MTTMPKPSTLKLPPLDLGPETLGQRLARLRKERGYSQVELAEKMGIIQQLITAYEHDRLRLHAEMVIRFARALDVSTDELLLGLNKKAKAQKGTGLSLKIVRRLQRIEQLPELRQKTLLKSIDLLLDGAGQA